MDTFVLRDRAATETAADKRLRYRTVDTAQITIRRAIDVLKLASHDLLLVVDGCIDPAVSDAAQAARDQVLNAIQEAEGALRIAVDASGLVEVHEPDPKRYAAIPHVRAPR